jgi:hypothetical protein
MRNTYPSSLSRNTQDLRPTHRAAAGYRFIGVLITAIPPPVYCEVARLT